MLITALNWIYIFLTAYIIGFFLIPRLSKLIGAGGEIRANWCDNVVCGIVTATVYAEAFSLFYKVGLASNLIMILCCSLFVFIDRARLRSLFESRLHLPEGKVRRIAFILLCLCAAVIFILALMFTAEGTFHYDTGLYHAQSIHWLEDYGIIKGLGLIHIRFAYNSAYFPLCALYSLRDVMQGQSLHSMSGFLFALMCMYSFYGWLRSMIKKHPENSAAQVIPSFIRMAPLLYFIICILNITSPESDYITGNLIIWVFLRLCEVYEERTEEDRLSAFCLISVCAFALIGYKLSAAVIPLIALWPLVILVKKKQWRSILVCALLCALTILPYLARNVMICGWPVYPVTHFDFFDVPWKFDRALVRGDAKEIENWARGLHMEGAVDSSFGAWLKYWWSVQYLGTQLIVMSLLMSFPLMIFTFFDRKKWFINYLTAVMTATIIFYMIKAPLIRYCYAPVIIIPLMTGGYITELALRRSKIALAAALIAVAVMMAPTVISAKEIIKYDYEESVGRFSPKDHLIRQIDYPSAKVKEMDWFGYKVYVPVEGDQCWYHAFPSSPYHEGFDNTMPVSGDLKNGVVKR